MCINFTKRISICTTVLILSFIFSGIQPLYSQKKNTAQIQEIKSGIKDQVEAGSEESLNNSDTLSENPDEEFIEPDNDNLFATLKQGGPLMIFLLILALISLTIIIERILFFTKNRVWDSNQLNEYIKSLAEDSKAIYREDMEDELRAGFQLYANSMERGTTLLSGIGNLSPIVGFLGTVIGMINAFSAIAVATTVNAKVVAVGIQIALVTTAGGLVVAAPSLGFLYLFTHIIQNRYTQSDEIINELTAALPRLSEKLLKEEA